MTRPSPPPEAVLIRTVREAARIKIPVAAKAAGISVARWSQVETGAETRAGRRMAVRAPAGTLAHMAHAVGISPGRLEAEGKRPDAAEVLREILRGHEPPSRPPVPVPSPGGPPGTGPAIQRILDDPDLTDAEKQGAVALIEALRRGGGSGKTGNG